MIKSKQELHEYLKVEKELYFTRGSIQLPFGIREKDVLFSYVKCLRKSEYYFNTNKKIRAFIYRSMLLRKSNLYGIHIGMNVCEVGLSIAHVGPIIINGNCHIGRNLRVHVGVNIGANGGNPPVIGDGVYIGPGAKIFGDIKIADGCRIGANAVVNKSCLSENSTLVGVPAQIV